ncbi:hypothetical protein TWF788_010261 [Orbilia oligospora]|uniref:Methyltransferase type 11 domain-containing protein n=1 Tax=Orbilia oligospora TaxID=2813651 RepID=A0A7C8KDK7_ORBOL|nr:hypothetical protein TWF788_010261 [Orbilia oligospora]
MAPPKKDFKGFGEWDLTPLRKEVPAAPKEDSKPNPAPEKQQSPRGGSRRSSNPTTSKQQSLNPKPQFPKVERSQPPRVLTQGSGASRGPLRPPAPKQKYSNIVLEERPSTTLTAAQKVKRVKGIYWITGIGVYALSSYGVYLYIQYGKAVKLNEENEKQYRLGMKIKPEIDTHKVYENISGKYDSNVRWSEFFMGMPLLRRWMMLGLQGDVLEASAGTGRNNSYYPVRNCNSVTMLDSSPNMLKIAKDDFERRYPRYGHISFAPQDAGQPIKSPSGEGFDRVIQTMGLCSQKCPVETLRNLEQHCKPGGKILLLEHGRSHYEWLNNILDAYVLDHARNWGCFWNRDIGGLLEESGLVVTKISRFHLGTTWLIEASPRPRKQDQTTEPGSESK